MEAARRQYRQKETTWAPPLQRDPGPWSRLVINWMATLAVIMAFGLVMLYSASYTTGYLRMGDSLHYIKQQILYMAIGIGCMAAMSYVDHRFLRWACKPCYWIVLIMLAATLAFPPLNGCRRWIRLGGLTLQTSEVVLLIMEPHMSGILLTTAIVGTILMMSGSGGIITWAGAGTAALLLETLLTHVNSIEYLQKRLKTWSDDLEKLNPQTKQSLYAIGSGGLKGLGLGNSVEKQLWLPESTNDFIFSVVCEELGFIGATLIIVLFILFIVQGLLIAYKAENEFCTMVGIGIMAQIAWQVFCNIAVVTNTIPNTGISLPFFSSGGTSLILLLAEMGVMVNIGRNGERAAQQRAADHARREAEHAAQEAERASRTINLEDARRAQNGK